MTIECTASVICGDLLLELERMKPDSFDALITDPPYCSGGLHRGNRVSGTVLTKYITNSDTKERISAPDDFVGERRDQRGFQAWVIAWGVRCHRVLKPGARFVCFIDWRNLGAMFDGLQASGLEVRGIGVWDKLAHGCRPTLSGIRQQAEFIVWGSRPPFEPREDIPGTINGVISLKLMPSSDRLHLTQKPIALMRELMRLCPEGGTVLDPFCGSGTTLIAALDMKRHAVGVEMDAGFAKVARDRIDGIVHKPNSAQVDLFGASMTSTSTSS